MRVVEHRGRARCRPNGHAPSGHPTPAKGGRGAGQAGGAAGPRPTLAPGASSPGPNLAVSDPAPAPGRTRPRRPSARGEHAAEQTAPRPGVGPRRLLPGRSPMDVLLDRCAGIDVHKKTVVACIRVRVVADGRKPPSRSAPSWPVPPPPTSWSLADWLAGMGARHLAMESTGVYWKPVWHLLEGRFELMPVNARHIKQGPRPARPTSRTPGGSPSRCSTACSPPSASCRRGRVPASWGPDPAQRAQLVADKAAVADRVHEALEDANIKLSLKRGDRDPRMPRPGDDRRADRRRVRPGAAGRPGAGEPEGGRRIPAPWQALEGRVTEHHRFLLRSAMDQLSAGSRT